MKEQIPKTKEMEAREFLKLATKKTVAGKLISENNLTETVIKLLENYAKLKKERIKEQIIIPDKQEPEKMDAEEPSEREQANDISPLVVVPKGTFCRCGKPYSQKDLEDGMCNKCCAPTG